MHLTIARGSTDLLVQALRARTLDALVVDARSLRPRADLQVEHAARDARRLHVPHAAIRWRGGAARVRFDAVQRYPIASTPLSDEVARMPGRALRPARPTRTNA